MPRRRPIPPPNESTVDLHFPLAGVDISQAYDQQPNKPLPSGLGYARTSPLAINVRAYEPGTGRARGGSRRGATKYVGAVVLGNASIQCLAEVTITAGNVPGTATSLSPLYAAIQSASPTAGAILEYQPLSNILTYTPVAPPYFLTATAFVTNATSGASNGQGAGSDGTQTNPSLTGIANNTPVVQAFFVASGQFLYVAGGTVTTPLTTLSNSTLIVNASVSVCTAVLTSSTPSVVIGTQTNGTIFSIGIDQSGSQVWSNFSQGISFGAAISSSWSVTDNAKVYSIGTGGTNLLQTIPGSGNAATPPVLTTTTLLAQAVPGYLAQTDTAEGGPAYQSIAVAPVNSQIAVCMLTPFSQLSRSQNAALAFVNTGVNAGFQFSYQPVATNSIGIATPLGVSIGVADTNTDYLQCSCWDQSNNCYFGVTNGPGASGSNWVFYSLTSAGAVNWGPITISQVAGTSVLGMATDGTYVYALVAHQQLKPVIYRLLCSTGAATLWYTTSSALTSIATFTINSLSLIGTTLCVGGYAGGWIELVNTSTATLIVATRVFVTVIGGVTDVDNDGTYFYTAGGDLSSFSSINQINQAGGVNWTASPSNPLATAITYNSVNGQLAVCYQGSAGGYNYTLQTYSTAGALIATAKPNTWANLFCVRHDGTGGYIIVSSQAAATNNMAGIKGNISTITYTWGPSTFWIADPGHNRRQSYGIAVNGKPSVLQGQISAPQAVFSSFSLPGMTAPIGNRVCSDGTDFYFYIPLYNTNAAGVVQGVVSKISGSTGAVLWTCLASPMMGYVPTPQAQPTIAYIPGSPNLIQVSGAGQGSISMLASSGAFTGEGLGALTQNTVGCAILSGSFTSAVGQGMTSKAQDVLVAVSVGSVAITYGGTWNVVTGGSSVLNTSATVIRAAQLQGKLYFVDNLGWWRYNPATNAMEAWVASSGSLPIGPNSGLPRLITSWRGSILLAGWLDDPRNWALSATNDATNWNFFPVPIVVTQAINGTNSSLGQVGDVITCLIAYSDDVLIFGGDHTIYQMQGDPRYGGQLALITDTVGIAFGSPWTRDPYGNIYFVSNLMGIYVFQPGSGNVPQRISQQIEQFLQNLNPATTIFNMIWDDQDQGVHVYCSSSLSMNVPCTHFFWEQRTGGWMVDQYPNFMNPKCVLKYAGNTPSDRVALIGSWDGYVRSLSGNTTTDDGNPIVSQIVIGPILSKDLDDILLKDLQGILGMNSGQVQYAVYIGPTAEIALSSNPVAVGVWTAGRNPATYIRRAGHAIYVKITATNYWSMEAIRCRIAGLGKVRQRAPK